MTDPCGTDAVRLDKWLWAARFFKTRSLARDEIERGRVTVNEQAAKPARDIRAGDRVDLRRGPLVRSFIVMAASDIRGPAPVAAGLYRETEASIDARERHAAARREAGGEPAAALAHGRPTKRDRRELAEWNRWSASSDTD